MDKYFEPENSDFNNFKITSKHRLNSNLKLIISSVYYLLANGSWCSKFWILKKWKHYNELEEMFMEIQFLLFKT